MDTETLQERRFENVMVEKNSIGELELISSNPFSKLIIGKVDKEAQLSIQIRDGKHNQAVFPIDVENLDDVIHFLRAQRRRVITRKSNKMKKILLLSITLFLCLTASAQHFTNVWEGNGTGHMNIYITSGTIDGQPISNGDEIAIYSGDKCVGYAIVKSDYVHKDYVLCDVITSMNDGTGNGFIVGSPIVVKIWDASANKIPEIINVTYSNELSFWTTNGMFSQGGSAFIQLQANNIIKKKVLLKSGINTLVISLNPSSTSLVEFFKPLIDQGFLLKVQDMKGRSFERVNSNVWINSIGVINPEESYTVIVSQDCEFEFSGIVKY